MGINTTIAERHQDQKFRATIDDLNTSYSASSRDPLYIAGTSTDRLVGFYLNTTPYPASYRPD